MLEELRMLTTDEVQDLLNVKKETLAMWRELNILCPIRTGRNFMYTQDAIKRFQKKYEGYDLSNRLQATLSIKDIEDKKSRIESAL